MDKQHINYQRIAEAIHYIQQNFQTQPSLEEIAEHVHLSPFHFQRIFTEWAGVSPKKFLQYISIKYAKQVLKNEQATLFDATHETGLSSPGRLHDLFISIEGMTPGEYKNGGEHLTINYSFAETPFGEVLIASTAKGICLLVFVKDQQEALAELQACFPKAHYQQQVDAIQQNTLLIFAQDWSKLKEIKLHLKGTEFQLKVWEALLKVPTGKLVSYSTLAEEVKNLQASRAVGSAVGSNPIAYLIPCHRVIRSSGELGYYHWGNTRKAALIGWEAAKLNGGKP